MAILLGVALALRVAVVVLLWAPQSDRPLAYEHGRIAENLLAGQGFSIEFLGVAGPTSQQAPFYPLLLVPFYAMLGPGSPGAILAVQLVQCLAGTLLVLAVVWLGWALAPQRPQWGWIAGLLAAVYPTHLYMVTHLQVALWAALVLTLLLAMSVSNAETRWWRGPWAAGLLAGLLLLIEPILAIALPIAAIAWWLKERKKAPHASILCLLRKVSSRPSHSVRSEESRGKEPLRYAQDDGNQPSATDAILAAIRGPAIMAVTAAAIIAPWTIRNRLVHGQWTFIKSTFGYAFWQGNHPLSWGTDKIPKASAEMARRQHDGTLSGMNRALWEARHETLYIDDALLKPGGYREFQGLSEPARSALLGRQAWASVSADPAHYGRLCLQRLRYFLLFDETNPKASNLVYRASTVGWLLLATLGLIASRGCWRQLWPTYAIFALVMGFHALVIVSARFRIPVEPLSLVWAAAAIEPVAAWLAGRSFWRNRLGSARVAPGASS